ncbi:MAG: polyprenyl synthetase family protein [Treponema sp.]|nr:polyprenyl synthetase family protein [Treponema sp.]
MENQYKLRLEKIEEVLDSWLPVNPEHKWAEKIFGTRADRIDARLLKSLSAPGRDLIDRGGKRWRPLLMLLIAQAIGGEKAAAAALPLTVLVELCHNASLIHDDIEDNSDERRGKPAVHLVYGSDTAINSGSFLYFLPLACLDSGLQNFSAETKNQILKTWGIYMRRLHLGQAMDISWHRDFYSLPQISEYEKMCRLKTGCLAGMAAALAVVCAGDCLKANGCAAAATPEAISDELSAKLTDAAEKLGVGFQILDDVKNLRTGNPGKKRGDDIVEGKKSLPVLLYLHKYPEKREFTAACFRAASSKGIAAPELEEIILAMQNAGVLDEAQRRGAELIGGSRQTFIQTDFFDAQAKALLGGLIDFISDI